MAKSFNIQILNAISQNGLNRLPAERYKICLLYTSDAADE